MERRRLGRTGLEVAVLGFGCGAVGGLMVKGTPAEQERAVARAIELGIDYFDTAPSYGDGASERNLGRVLKALRPDVIVGTKFRLEPADGDRVEQAIAASLEASLRRLGLERVDLLQLHNPVGRGERMVDPATLLDRVLPALERLRAQGKIRFLGITALGDPAALHRAVEAGVLDTAQVCYNLLNPSAGGIRAAGGAEDFAGLLDRARRAGVGTIGIRVLAGGAISGTEARHPYGMPSVEPIASGPDYRTDVERARRLGVLVSEGHADSLVEAAIRFAIAHPGMSTVLVGYSTLEQLEQAAVAVRKGPLSRAALDRIAALHDAARA